MNIKHLEYFITLAKEKSFSRASELLGVTQPTLSQSVQKLEGLLGTSLFDRSFPAFTLTQEGRILLDSCRKITDIWNQTCTRITEMHNGVTGSVTVGISPFRAPYTAPVLVERFHREYPLVRLGINEMKTEEMFDSLDAGEIDLAITACDKRTASKYAVTPAFTEEVLIAVPKNLLSGELAADNGDAIQKASFSEFNGMNFIVLGNDQLLYKQYKALCEKTDCRMHTVTGCTNIETSLTLANAGSGAAFLLSTGLAYCKDRFPNLRYFRAVPEIPGRTVYVLHRKNQYLSNPAKYLCEIAGENFSDRKETET